MVFGTSALYLFHGVWWTCWFWYSQKKYFLLTFVCCTQHAINVLILHLVMLLLFVILFFLDVNSTGNYIYNYLHLGWVFKTKRRKNQKTNTVALKNLLNIIIKYKCTFLHKWLNKNKKYKYTKALTLKYNPQFAQGDRESLGRLNCCCI